MPQTNEQLKDIKPRPPVVVVLGHVDHGKSSILEAIKDLKITEKESGGITQHIGAYEIEHQSSSGDVQKITFIDTPGHEAFSAIRARGARVADIAVLVIASDEGVKEQTKEAILHIKKANLPFIVALNKSDKPGANPEKIKRELAVADVLTESMGGEVPTVNVSALSKEGINDLLELILLLAEMQDLKEDILCPAKGVVIESHLDSLRGPVATLIVEEGTIKCGDIVGTCSCVGKIKILHNSQGLEIEKAFPSMPVLIVGFSKVPKVGEEFMVFKSSNQAQEFIQGQKPEIKQQSTSNHQEGQKTLGIILKADVLGSLEAIEGILSQLPRDKVVLKILKSGAGTIDESDVKLASASGALIFGFRTKPNFPAVKLAEREKIQMLVFDIIYELIEKVRKAIEKSIDPELIKTVLGRMEVLAVFLTEKNRQILGGKVIDGHINKGSLVEVYRKEELVGKGKIINLKKNQKDIDSVSKKEDCGLLFEGDIRVEERDIIESYTKEWKKVEL